VTRGLAIAIDGPGSAGKGTVARAVARALGYRYIDTGAMYRTVALACQRVGVSWKDGPAVAAVARRLRFDFGWDGDVLRVRADGEDVSALIRAADISQGASDVSALPDVRAALLDLQRALGAEGGVVMDGRDIGTVVLPEAGLKIFLDADLDERARRRHEELLRQGDTSSFAEVRDALAYRDRQDSQREIAPMRAAPDAVRVDTTDLTIRGAADRVIELATARGARRGAGDVV
jgi:cytidylate kinase